MCHLLMCCPLNFNYSLQITLLLHFSFPNNSVNSLNGEIFQNQMSSLEEIFNWLSILWERGLCHDNPQGTTSLLTSWLINWISHCIVENRFTVNIILSIIIQPTSYSKQESCSLFPLIFPFVSIAVRCLIMQSFLGIEWKKHRDFAKSVPESFVFGSFMQALNDPVHHKDFGLFSIWLVTYTISSP